MSRRRQRVSRLKVCVVSPVGKCIAKYGIVVQYVGSTAEEIILWGWLKLLLLCEAELLFICEPRCVLHFSTYVVLLFSCSGKNLAEFVCSLVLACCRAF